MVNTRTGFNALRCCVVALLLSLPGAVLGADAGKAPASASQRTTVPDEELEETLVRGNRIKPTRDPQKIVNWLKLLVGQFRYDGDVKLEADEAPETPLQVRGVADCTAFGLAPGVHCSMKVVWPEVHGKNGAEIPGGVSTLVPAMIQYGLDPDHLGIRYLQVDSKGLANYGQGYLVNDTLTTTMPCPDIAGNCQRVARIHAGIDGKLIDMQIDIERDYQPVARFTFLLHRVGAVPKGAISGGAR